MTRKNGRMKQVVVTVMVLGAFLVNACSDQGHEPVAPQTDSQFVTEVSSLSKDNPGIKRAMEVQNRNTERFLEMQGVIGTGTGLDEEGNPAVIIFTKHALGRSVIPASLDGIPVIENVVGEIEPVSFAGGGKVKPTSSKKTPSQTSTTNYSPTSRNPRPVPIGISTGNINVCGGGTIGVRVRDGENYYALSCNHVWGRLNAAQVGENVVQPASSDAGCAKNLTDVVAQIAGLEPIVHLSTASNLMDVTMVSTSTAEMSNSTPSDGYGTPSSTPVDPIVGQAVQKYGRTTSLTKGKISAINVTLGLNYGYGTARFVGQIAVEPATKKGTFVDTGDSGSLVVTGDSNADPVGLVFARSGSITYVNPIKPILARFNVVIDGK